ncbi:MAG: hypothetical protein D5S00_10515 [Tindallia sp. MSAO_Bac2]|nr:MAG: hypothetical protein D5S00_10515 [Tindallia sp. MSAO_Bac2]
MTEIDKDRVIHYTILSRLLTDQLKTGDMKKLIELSESLTPGSGDLVANLKQEMKLWLVKQDDEPLRVEYAHLFLMPEGVKAYESVYRTKDGLMMQEPWERVRSFYLKHGLRLEGEKTHPEDHASVELAFMALLIENKETEKVQKEFFKQHISCWMPKLFEDMKGNPYADFYNNVALYGDSFLQQETKRLVG